MDPADKVPLSVCIIAQDEEKNLPAALDSVAFAGEVVVLDGGSRDRTREIARERGARVEERPFDGWISQKNAALALARHDWVLSLDADERVSPGLAREIQELFAGGEPPCDAYRLPRRAWHLGRWIRGGGWYPDHKVRLFRRSRSRFTGRDPHDHVDCRDCRVGTLRGDLLHYPYEDLGDHVRRMVRYTEAAACSLHREGRRWPLLRLAWSPPFRFFKAYVLRGGFRDGAAGFVLAVLAAVYEALRYARLWDLRRQERARRGAGGLP